MRTVYLMTLFLCATHTMNVPDLLESAVASLCSAKGDISKAITQAKSDCPFCSDPCDQRCLNSELSELEELLSKIQEKTVSVQSTACVDCPFDCSASRSCPPGFVQNGTSCYFFSDFSTGFIEAAGYCQLFGAKLATIEDKPEDDFIRGYALSDGGAVAYYLGGSDLRVEGTFYWEHPLQPVVYTNWNPPGPDNTGDLEHCMEIRKDFDNYRWNDFRCNGNINFICEKTL